MGLSWTKEPPTFNKTHKAGFIRDKKGGDVGEEGIGR